MHNRIKVVRGSSTVDRIFAVFPEVVFVFCVFAKKKRNSFLNEPKVSGMNCKVITNRPCRFDFNQNIFQPFNSFRVGSYRKRLSEVLSVTFWPPKQKLKVLANQRAQNQVSEANISRNSRDRASKLKDLT